MKKVVLALFLFASPAGAEFTPAEKAELRKVIETRLDMGEALKRLAFHLPNIGSAATKPAIVTLLGRIEDADWRCTIAFALMSNDNVGSQSQPPNVPRGDNVAGAFQAIRSCRDSLNQAILRAGELEALEPSTSNVKFPLQSGLARLETFDESLPYLDWEPPDAPKLVGPHGDLRSALRHLSRSMVYFHQTWQDANRVISEADNINTTGWNHLRKAFSAAGGALQVHQRAWGMDLEIVLPDDEAIILNDQAQGSGLRPFRFFRLLLQTEYILSRGPRRFPPLPSGRGVKMGYGGFLTTMGGFFARFGQSVAASNASDAQELVRIFSPGGMLSDLFYDITDSWGDSDAVGIAYLLFFHEIPDPPGGTRGVTCGPGTHEENSVCVPDLPPTCNPYVPSVVTIDHQTVQVQCVEVP